MDKIAVLIPCYNESFSIEKVVTDFKKYLPEATIYVYDNDSTDGTDEIARKAGAIVRYEHKQGKGNVIRTMFREIDAECYILCDGDDTYPAKSAPEFAKHILEKNVDMVIGDRLSSTYFKENKRLFHGFGNRLVRALINGIYKSKIRDVMTGYRAFSYRFVKTFPVLSKRFEIETEMTIHALDKNLNIKNIIVEYKDRPKGSKSKVNTVPDGIKVLKTITNLYKNYKPLSFFLWITFILWVIGIAFFIPVFIEYLQTGLVPRLPTFLASVFFLLCGIQSFTCGLILQTIVERDKQKFEITLNRAQDRFNDLKEKNNK